MLLCVDCENKQETQCSGDDIMKTLFEKILNEYIEAKRKPFAGHPMGTFFRNDIPREIYSTGLVNTQDYLVTGSVGQGNWATIPWVCIFDRKITTSATKGVYIVYLLNRDANSLYLTFNQGCTDIRNSHSKRETIRIMREKAAEIAAHIDSRGFHTDEHIFLGNGLTELAELYQKGTIFYKEYKKGSVPDEEELRNDLSKMMAIYQEYAEQLSGSQHAEAWLLNNGHPIGVFDSWEILNETTAVKTCDKSFFDYNGSGVPKGICWFFEAEKLQSGENKQLTLHYNENTYTARVTNESSDRRRVRIFWGKDLGDQLVAFRDRKDVKAVFTKVSSAVYEVRINHDEEVGEEEMPVSTKEAMKQIKEYIAAKGFSYKDELIENFFLSLKSKPFVILAGTSGTGKTRLVRLFAEAIGAEYKLVSVRPDWSDGSDLFGHYDLNGNFINGPVCECFDMAYAKPNKPVFLCLDEMNLARVEYYLSDFLSVVESREKHADSSITTAGIAQYENGIPDNLYIVGTVNMDETTFPFSKKVLDRANTIEFSYLDLIPTFDSVGAAPEKLQLPNSFLRTEYLVLSRDCINEQQYVLEICAELQKINEILLKANAHVGYRVRDEIVFYMLNNKAEGNLLTHNEAMDNEIMQKILPRIQGSSASVRDMLCELFVVCASDHNQKNGDCDSEKMRKVLDDASIGCPYPKSAAKLELMVRRFEEDGFTSYWL